MISGFEYFTRKMKFLVVALVLACSICSVCGDEEVLAFDDAKKQQISGTITSGDASVEIEVTAAKLPAGVKNRYRTSVENGAYSLDAFMFPGLNFVTVKTANGVEKQIIRPFTVKRPDLEIAMHTPGNIGYYKLEVRTPSDSQYIYTGDDDVTQSISWPSAEPGLYQIAISCFHEINSGATSVFTLSSMVTIYLNGKAVRSIFKFNQYERYMVGNIVIHGDDTASGYMADEDRHLGLVDQGALVGADASDRTHVIGLNGPNGVNSVYMDVGESVQFNATGYIEKESSYFDGVAVQGGVNIIGAFSSSNTDVGFIRKLGAFTAENYGHTQVSCESYGGPLVDVYVGVDINLSPNYNNDAVVDFDEMTRSENNEMYFLGVNNNDNDGDADTIDKDRLTSEPALSIADPDMKQIKVTFSPVPNEGTVTLTVPPEIRLWVDAKKTSLISTRVWTWNEGDLTQKVAFEAFLAGEVWVEGLTPGAIELELSFSGVNGIDKHSLKMAVVKLDLVPDYNRDGVIDQDDKDRAASDDIYRFWINDDEDVSANEGSNVPGTGNPDYGDNIVNGLRDLNDFFPVMLDVSDTIPIFGLDKYTYWLYPESGVVNIVVDEKDSPVCLYLDKCNMHVFDPDKAEEVLASKVRKVDSSGIELKVSFMIPALLKKSVVLLEGASDIDYNGTTASGKLTIEIRAKSDGSVVWKSGVPLKISSVKKMYRQLNLRGVCGGTEGDPSNIHLEPSNLPDSETGLNNVVYIHGYNVNGNDAAGEQSAIFKNLWWCGSRAKFHAISWYGDATQISALGFTPNFYTNVANAFATAPLAASYIKNLNGDTSVIAHSLGNMLASAAICLEAASPENYFMLDSAVSMEAYGFKLKQHAMLNQNWADYTSDGYPNRLFASEWHTLFGTGDGRSKLTMRGLFTNWGNTYVVNCYSSGEEVLANAMYGEADDWTEGLDAYGHVWCAQEKLKGRIPDNLALTELPAWWAAFEGVGKPVLFVTPWAEDWIQGYIDEAYPNKEGGWMINSANLINYYSDLTSVLGVACKRRRTLAEMLNPIITSEVTLQEYPLFTLPDELTGVNASTYATAKRYYLLGHVFPATTYAAGRNPLGVLAIDDWNMNDMSDSLQHGWWQDEEPSGWRWVHNDCKNITLLYTQELFKKITNEGGLK